MLRSWRDPAHDSGHEHDRRRKYFSLGCRQMLSLGGTLPMTAVMNMTGRANISPLDADRSFRAALACLVPAVVWLDSVGRPESLGEDFEVAEACNV
jgi:hypothetical protein